MQLYYPNDTNNTQNTDFIFKWIALSTRQQKIIQEKILKDYRKAGWKAEWTQTFWQPTNQKKKYNIPIFIIKDSK